MVTDSYFQNPLHRLPEAFSGLLAALPTPFSADQGIDLPTFRRLVRRALAGGAAGLVVLGSTGEAPSLEEAERDEAHLIQEQLRPLTRSPRLRGRSCPP